jgi:hypothetical protein
MDGNHRTRLSTVTGLNSSLPALGLLVSWPAGIERHQQIFAAEFWLGSESRPPQIPAFGPFNL